MTAPTEFEKRLVELNLTYAQIELVKQAVEKAVIGKTEFADIHHQARDRWLQATGRNQLRSEQRKALRG